MRDLYSNSAYHVRFAFVGGQVEIAIFDAVQPYESIVMLERVQRSEAVDWLVDFGVPADIAQRAINRPN